MKKITSKQCPPKDTHVVLTMQRRGGERFEYHTGAYGKESEMKRECGGCAFCISIVGVQVNGEHRMSSSHPSFYRFIDYECKDCKPVLKRLQKIDSEIIRLNYEKEELLRYYPSK